ncbi:transmembrane protein 53-A isoform X3 [Photinus pyralis]|uniref:transmembrane protein 53-A isoform X3 n=1 Tax=Photinus pyralis TaxID=7054 RepID=UPI001267313C|nr:transmembrane protein 53-A isoform X3 [Photinus pyralis]
MSGPLLEEVLAALRGMGPDHPAVLRARQVHTVETERAAKDRGTYRQITGRHELRKSPRGSPLLLERGRLPLPQLRAGASARPETDQSVIFDSGPGPRRFVSLYRAISAIISGNVIYNFVIAALLTSFLIVVWECEILKSYFVNDDYQSDPIEYLKIEDNKCPQYFIYSKADKLIFYEDVENFINIRRNNGVDVSVLTFDDSPHVKHYAHYKNEYSEGVNNFLVGCLKN